MELKVNFTDDFSDELKQDIIEATEWLNQIVDSYEYNRAIKKYGYEEDNEVFLKLLDGFTVNFEIWHVNTEYPCKYIRERNCILLNLDVFPHFSKELMAAYIAHEVSHEDDRFDHKFLQKHGFPYFTIYKISKMSLKVPFHIRVWNFIKGLFK